MDVKIDRQLNKEKVRQMDMNIDNNDRQIKVERETDRQENTQIIKIERERE